MSEPDSKPPYAMNMSGVRFVPCTTPLTIPPQILDRRMEMMVSCFDERMTDCVTAIEPIRFRATVRDKEGRMIGYLVNHYAASAWPLPETPVPFDPLVKWIDRCHACRDVDAAVTGRR